MTVQITTTTDGKHVGEVYEVPLISKEVMLNFGMHADRISWTSDICTVQNANYTLKLKKIKD
jgi:hypothetical protein